MNGIVRMIVRLVLMRGVAVGISKLSSWWSNRDLKKKKETMSEDEYRVAQNGADQGAKKNAKRARQTMRMARRMRHFK